MSPHRSSSLRERKHRMNGVCPLFIKQGRNERSLSPVHVGQGDKEAALVVKFNDESNKSLVWGYRWSGTATGEDMFRAIAQSDSRLILFTQQTNYNGTVCGIGYYPDGNVLSDVTFDLDGAMSDSRVISGTILHRHHLQCLWGKLHILKKMHRNWPQMQ